MSETGYRTVAGAAVAEIEVSRSRFRCLLEPVADEAAARAVIDGVRKRDWDARHHCSAFVLGPDRAIERSNDDGEPAGTAGAPMLDVLRGAGLSDVVAVVTRWFGGVLLGTGGLARAYGDAVRAGIAAADLERRIRVERFVIEADHADAGRLENALRAHAIRVLQVCYAERATLVVAAPPDGTERLDALVGAATGGGACARPDGATWVRT